MQYNSRGGSRKKYLGGLAPRPLSRNVVWGVRRRRRRREWGLGRGYPLPQWVWGLGAPSPEKKFDIFSFEMVHFDAFWSTF